MQASSCFINYEEMLTLYSLIYRSSHHSKLSEITTAQLYEFMTWDHATQHLLNPKDTLQLFLTYYENVVQLRYVNRIPIAVSFTYELAKAAWANRERSWDCLALAITRHLNQIVDLSQKTKVQTSFVQGLKALGVPEVMADIASETRHAIVHKSFPSLRSIEATATYFIWFLKEQFWEENIRQNCDRLSEERLEWTLERAGRILKTALPIPSNLLSSLNEQKLLRKLPKAVEKTSRQPKDAEELDSFNKGILKEICSKNPSALSLSAILKESKLPQKKYKACLLLLEEVANSPQATESALKKAEFIAKFFSEQINVSEFRSFFLKPEFAVLIKRLMVFKITRKDFDELWQAFESHYHKVLLTSKFVSEWQKPESDTSDSFLFDHQLFKRMDNQYNTFETYEIMQDYWKHPRPSSLHPEDN